MKPTILIIGAGGHGKVVYDAVISEGKYNIIGYVDDAIAIGTEITNGIKIISSLDEIKNIIPQPSFFIVAIGNNSIRKKIYETISQTIEPATIIHPKSIIGCNVKIGVGTIVLANSIINASSIVGENSIINSGVIIDHDCNIGNHVYLKLGCIIGNNTKVSDNYLSEFSEKIIPFTTK